jgi:proteasome accessory factor A
MIEAGWVNPMLLLDDPVGAVTRWSHDPTLQARAKLASGEDVTAVALQLRFLEEAKRFCDAGLCDGVVPRAAEIMGLWEDTLARLASGDFAALVPRLDWVLKLSILQRAMRRRPDLTWASPEIKHLDHVYSSLDPSEGLYWSYERSGVVERAVSEEWIDYFTHEPPEDSRAWTRASLLRLAGPDAVDAVDWDFIRFKIRGKGYWPARRTLDMANPLAFTRAAVEPLLGEGRNLDDVLDGLEARRPIAAGPHPEFETPVRALQRRS